MSFMKNLLTNKNTRTNLVTYLVVIAAFVVMQSMNSAGMLGSSVKGYLVPICVYISLAVSLNLRYCDRSFAAGCDCQ